VLICGKIIFDLTSGENLTKGGDSVGDNMPRLNWKLLWLIGVIASVGTVGSFILTFAIDERWWFAFCFFATLFVAGFCSNAVVFGLTKLRQKRRLSA
jgi:hypothetical protein